MKKLFTKGGLKRISLPPLRGKVRMGGLLARSFLIGSGFALGLIAVTVAAVTVGTVKTWTTGETLTATDLNSTITSLKTALEAIPNWTKSGTNAVYTDGNVGIGTTGPTFPLHVKAPPSTDVMKLQSANGNNIIWFKDLSDVAQGYVGYGSGNQFHVFQAQAGPLNFHTNSQQRMTIDSSGNVGIGTTSPGALLHIVGESGGTYASVFGLGGSGDTYIRGSKAASRVFIGDNNTGDVLIVSTGNVGIGTTTPGYPLTMGSGAYVTTGGVWTNASSREYKENLEDLTAEEALAAVMALAPQKFNYRKDKGDCAVPENRKPSPPPSPFQGEGFPSPRRGEGKGEASPCDAEQYVGFIAEDVPALVATNDRKGLSSMDLVAVLTKVVQEQQERINELTERVVELERN